jgi:hypothetical protein
MEQALHWQLQLLEPSREKMGMTNDADAVDMH